MHAMTIFILGKCLGPVLDVLFAYQFLKGILGVLKKENYTKYPKNAQAMLLLNIPEINNYLLHFILGDK